MAIRRLRETLVCQNKDYQVINEVPENLRESFDNVTRRRMTEAVNDSANWYKELDRLVESNKSFEPIVRRIKESGIQNIPKLWKFPIARFDNLNGNRRVYTRKLFENVINKQQDIWKGAVGLCDHPKEDDDAGEMKYAAIVWLDMAIDDESKLIWGIGTFVGPYGRLAQEIIEAGGRVGFSSSGFGDTLYDGVTVDPDNYLIERSADLVLNPSQGVFGDATNESLGGNIEYATANRVKESQGAPVKSQIITNKKETTMPTIDAVNAQTPAAPHIVESAPAGAVYDKYTNLSKLEEKMLRKSITTFVESAKNIENPTARLKEMAEILSAFHEGFAPDLREKLEEQLLAERDGLEKLVESAVTLKKEFGVDNLDTFRESAKNLAVEATILKDENIDYQRIVECLTERNTDLNKKVKLLEQRLALKSKFTEGMKEKSSRAIVANDTQITQLRERLEESEASLSDATMSVRKLSEGNKSLEKELGLTKTKLRESTRKLEDALATNEKVLRESGSTSADVQKLREENEALAGQVTRLQSANQTLIREAQAVRSDFKRFKEQVEIDNTPNAHVIPAFKERVSSSLNMREGMGNEIESYWGDLYKRYGESILPYERHIRGAKTYREASNAFMRNRQFIDPDFASAENARITEGAIPQKDRKRILESSGMGIANDLEAPVDDVNARFLKAAASFGLG